MTVCNRCGKENQDHYKFCLGCGAELTAPKPGGGDMGMMKTMMADPSQASPMGAPLGGGPRGPSGAMPGQPPMRPSGGGMPGMPPSGPLGGAGASESVSWSPLLDSIDTLIVASARFSSPTNRRTVSPM